ncbi:MAG TPA: transglycosylase domain-containing protein [Thermoanaerobaculia bacterium]|nr:transglycosylase domain-containing protein [Thermoanaerobaculia bacterium]
MKRAAVMATMAIVALAVWVRCGGIAADVLDGSRFDSVRVVDRNGVVLYESLSASGGRGNALDATRLPANAAAATLAAEDHRFFRHPGVDARAIVRAAVRNVREGRVVEGGSTLSQQVAKLLLRSPERSVTAKLRETVLALRLEHRFTKNEILAMYLSLAPYGNRIHGIDRASRTYFGCAPHDLTPAQAAYLAALPQRPGAFNPQRDPHRAVKRQRAILVKMNLPRDEYERAISERVEVRQPCLTSDRQDCLSSILSMHFVERVLASTSVRRGTIRTTLDAGLQRDVGGIIAAQRERLLSHRATSVAVAVLDNRTGGWLAWEGSGDYFGRTFGGAIDGVITPRQPGSALKPFTYALAFEKGHSPATVLADIPSHFPTAEKGVTYSPRNYDGRYRGPLRVRYALGGSQNVPAVAMLSRVGTGDALHLLRKLGLSTLGHTSDYYGLGLALGDPEVRLDELIVAYSAFPRGKVFSPRTAFWISDILSDPEAREYAFGSGGSLDFPFRVAVKTGTSQAYRDNWTIGYTRDVTVGVWVGNFGREELHNSSGVTGAAPIFNAVMLAAMKRVRGKLPIGDDAPIVSAPADVETVRVCGMSGLRPSPYCPSQDSEWLATSAPAQFCDWHHDGYVDYPSEYRGWSGGQAILPVRRGRRDRLPSTEALRIANPPDGATYLIDPTLRASFQKLRFKANAAVTWRVNDQGVQDEWPLEPGRHTITAVDARGRRDSVRIFVK